jgi:hypothetical protein
MIIKLILWILFSPLLLLLAPLALLWMLLAEAAYCFEDILLFMRNLDRPPGSHWFNPEGTGRDGDRHQPR